MAHLPPSPSFPSSQSNVRLCSCCPDLNMNTASAHSQHNLTWVFGNPFAQFSLRIIFAGSIMAYNTVTRYIHIGNICIKFQCSSHTNAWKRFLLISLLISGFFDAGFRTLYCCDINAIAAFPIGLFANERVRNRIRFSILTFLVRVQLLYDICML